MKDRKEKEQLRNTRDRGKGKNITRREDKKLNVNGMKKEGAVNKTVNLATQRRYARTITKATAY